MQKVISKDGTTIAYDKVGTGPAVILVDGALCYRGSGPMVPIARILQERFTVITYDRRGRGESGDTKPYTPEKEIEDLEALIHAVGGSAFFFGASSGVALALDAAARLKGVKKLALYEAPFIVDDSREPLTHDYYASIDEAIASHKSGVAVKIFLKSVGVPGVFLAIMSITPVWKKLKSVAHTLPYDFAFVKDGQKGSPLNAERWTNVKAPTLVMVGGKSPAWMQHGMRALSDSLSDSELRTLEGQTHLVKAGVVVPVLAEFFNN